MDLCELGALLRAERERRGLSLDAVADQTKITRTCLTAIEEGNEKILPHPVYAKGFIKNYAKLLGMANQDFLDSLARIYQTEEEPVHSVPLLHEVADGDEPCACQIRSGGKRGRALVVGIVALLLLGGLGWYAYTTFYAAPGGAKPPVAAPVTSETPAPAPAETPSAAAPAAPESASAPAVAASTPPAPTPETPAEAQPSAPTPVATPAPAAAPTAAPTPAPAAALPPGATPEDQAAQDIALNGQPAPATSPNAKHFTVGETGGHVVQLTANGRCWIQAGADGGTMHETILQAGDTFTGKFNNYLLMRLGNAGVVAISFDGTEYPLHAAKGAVKTLKFVGRKPESPAAKQPTPPAAATQSQTSETPAAEAKPDAAPATAAQTPAGDKELEVYGQDGSWVILLPDSGPPKEVYVKKGQRITVPFNAKIEVKLGNPSSVVFRYDGKEFPVTTEKGETKSVRFP